MWLILFSLTGLLAMIGSLIMPANVAADINSSEASGAWAAFATARSSDLESRSQQEMRWHNSLVLGWLMLLMHWLFVCLSSTHHLSPLHQKIWSHEGPVKLRSNWQMLVSCILMSCCEAHSRRKCI